MKFKWPSFIIIFLFINTDISANGSDSVFVTYRASEKFGFGDFIWEKSTPFYLTQKKTGLAMPKTQFNIKRKLDAGWDIIQFDSTKDAAQLRQNYLTVVPASNVWKYSEEVLELVNSKKLIEKQSFRVSYQRGSSDIFFSVSGVTVKAVYSDYNCADVIIDNRAALTALNQ